MRNFVYKYSSDMTYGGDDSIKIDSKTYVEDVFNNPSYKYSTTNPSGTLDISPAFNL